jgi:cell division protein ZapA
MPPASSMGQVTVTFNGRTYSLLCADGEETRLIELAEFVKRCAEALVEEFGQIGDDRVLLMAALTLADELMPAQPASVPADGAMRVRARNTGC